MLEGMKCSQKDEVGVMIRPKVRQVFDQYLNPVLFAAGLEVEIKQEDLLNPQERFVKLQFPQSSIQVLIWASSKSNSSQYSCGPGDTERTSITPCGRIKISH
jgi:hypothetical protein